ncbi:hypothetical protein MBLNU13_g02386t1 [Cladosporium sp. NU13]
MAPKRSVATRSSGAARRGHSNARGRGRGGSNSTEHARVLSDITEESVTQLHTEKQAPTQPKSQQRAAPNSKKRAFQDRAQDAATKGRETRAQAAKRAKQHHIVAGEPLPTQVNKIEAQDQTGNSLGQQIVGLDAAAEPSAPQIPEAYIPSLNLLFFVHLAELDTDPNTESITLNLIELTLTNSNWNGGLSGLVQPVSCFLVASLLTRKQNLVEDVAASVDMFGLEYQQLVEGYRLLWEWRDNMSGVVGEYAERLAELPHPGLLSGQDGNGGHNVDVPDLDEETNDRPEPERYIQAVEV